VVAEELGEEIHFLRLLGGEVIFLSDVIFEVEEFEFIGEVPVDEFVVSEANGAVGRKVVEVGVMPEERTFGSVGGGIFKNIGEALSVDFLLHFDPGDFEKSWVDVLDDHWRVGALIFRGDFWPVDDEGDAGASFVAADFTSSEGCVLRVVAGGSIVGHEDDDGVVGDFEAIEGVENLAERVVHAFEHGGVGFLVGLPLFVLVVGEEAAIRFEGSVNGVVGEIEVEGLLVFDRLFHSGNGFTGDGFGKVDFLAVVFFESGDVPDGLAITPPGREVFVSVIGAGTADVAACDIDVEAEGLGVSSGGVLSTEVGLAGVDGAVSCLLESLWKGFGLVAAGDF
jgi:hypothetical protein